MSYDFSQLNDKEFEILAVDLLSIAYNTRIERFKPGKDSGVDGRFFTDSSKEICLQCKHYLKVGYKGLISKLKKEESKKVKKINPTKYIFITSLPLSRANKEEIKNIFHPYIKRSDDIFGQEDLNSLLIENPKVEENHFKLWISNTTVFNRIINNAIKGRSEFELEQIKRKSVKYINTTSHDKALKILNEKHVLLISGEPGIGKTTLAENLCLLFASKDYEFIDIEESLSEAENIYAKGKKQIFYFDDFLGSNYFEAIENKKDSHIVKFIERIINDKTKRFILTTRTNILNFGIMYSSIFSNSKLQNNEYMLTIESLTAFDRARILYNHIWFSKLKEDFIEEYYKDKRYRKIISHNNFNPRLIEFITDTERLNVSSASDYWNYIVNTLDNPKDIWNDCFKIQNNEHVRNLVKLTVFNGGSITEYELQRSFQKLNKIENLRNTSHTEKDFQSTSKLASKSFLNRNKNFNNDETYSLFNPSIADFVLNEYSNNLENLANIFKSLNTVKSLEQLLILERQQIISQAHILKLKNILFYDAFKENKKFDYLIYISDLLKDDVSKKENINKLLINIIQTPSPIEEVSKLLGLLMRYREDLNLNDYGFLLGCINNRELDETEIMNLADFVEFMGVDDENIFDKLKSDFEAFLIAELDSKKDDIDISKFVSFNEYDGDIDICCDTDGLESELSSIVCSIIDDFYSDLIRNLDVDIRVITKDIDIDQMINDYISSQGEHYHEGSHSYANTFNENIDDLFERS